MENKTNETLPIETTAPAPLEVPTVSLSQVFEAARQEKISRRARLLETESLRRLGGAGEQSLRQLATYMEISKALEDSWAIGPATLVGIAMAAVTLANLLDIKLGTTQRVADEMHKIVDSMSVAPKLDQDVS